MIDNDYVNFYIGQVISYNDTFKHTDQSNSNLFSINVKIKVNNVTTDINDVIPSNNNIKQIPVIGENVLLYQGYSNKTSYNNREQKWYYLTTLGIQSNINNNILPTITANFTPDKDFIDTSVTAVQPYVGDILIEGRWGNTIRLGSTNSNSDKYYKQSPWKGDTVTDPIITLSTRKPIQPSDAYDIENLQNDQSSLYLTSTQKFPKLLLGAPSNKNSLSCYHPSESEFSKSQFIGVADRIVLKAKTDIAVIDSPSAILLNTTGEVKLGNDNANESMVHGDVLLNILQKILNQLNSPIQCGTMTGTFLDKSNTVAAQRLLQDLLSSTYFMKKNTY